MRYAPAFVTAATLATLPVYATSQQERASKGETRDSLIARAKVWIPTNIASMNLLVGPTGPGSFRPGETVTCDYTDKKLSGASPKFACLLPDGDELKVKYGGGNGEVYGEVVASRLLWALGFGADRMYSVRVICRGCPENTGGILRANGDRILDPAAVERKFGGDELLDRWHWKELEQTDAEAGGATLAHRDALKLLAVLLQHNDSKSKQQRMVCLSNAGTDGRCEQPLMMINDLGLTFGAPNPFNLQPMATMNLAEWSKLPIWKDEPGCVGNLRGSLTSTLEDPVISEAGREFLERLLMQLSDRQLRDMFEAGRAYLRPRAPSMLDPSGFPTADDWARVFKNKRAQIVDKRCA
jgi:hypothetical protein